MKKIVNILMSAILVVAMLISAGAGARADAADVEGFVGRLYRLVLGRECDEDGLKFWTTELVEGKMTGTFTAYGFFASDEYNSRARSDSDYVEDLYNTLLGRGSDPDGKEHWVTMLSTGTRRDIFEGFSNSPEFTRICGDYGIVRGDMISGYDPEATSKINLFVGRLYSLVLGRTCDTDGMTFWTRELLTRAESGSEVSYGFFASEEYTSRSKTDEQYVEDLYNTLLGRGSDPEGKSNWVNLLAGGASRTSVFNGFSQSPEFDGICNSYGIDRGRKIYEKTEKNKTVCIDPGHSSVMPAGYVPLGPGSSEQKLADAYGTSGRWSGLKEYELTLIVAQKLKAELEARGYNVIMTREDNNTAVDCVTRAKIANENADLNIRLHADALSSSSPNGAVAICITSHNPWHSEVYSGSRRLADCLISNYCSATGIRNRGVSEQDDMTGNNWSTVPCVLFEMGFMTNESDDRKMADPDFQVKMVRGLSDGVDQFFEG